MRSIPTRSCCSWAVAISHLCFADHRRSIADSMTCTAVARLQTIADRGPLNGFMTFCDVRDVANIDIRLASGRRGRFFFWGGHFLAVSGRLRCRRPHGSRPRWQRRENSAPINDRRATGRRDRAYIDRIPGSVVRVGWAAVPTDFGATSVDPPWRARHGHSTGGILSLIFIFHGRRRHTVRSVRVMWLLRCVTSTMTTSVPPQQQQQQLHPSSYLHLVFLASPLRAFATLSVGPFRVGHESVF